MSDIPPADFSALIPQGAEPRETDVSPSNAREPLPHQPLVTQLPQYDPSLDLASQIAQVLNEPAPQRDTQDITTATEFVARQEPVPPRGQEPEPTSPAFTQQPVTPAQEPPAQPSPVQGEGEGGSDAVSGSSAAPPDLPSGDETTFSLDGLARQLYGRDITAEEATAIIQLWRDASALSPAQKHQVAVAMGYVEDDTQQPPPPATHQPPPPSQPQGEDQDEVDPYLRPHLQPLQTELSNLRNQVQSLVSERQLSDQERMQQQVTAQLEAFRETHPYLTEEEHAALRLRARDRGIFAAQVDRTGDVATALNSALEYEMWNDENLRAKAIQVQQEQAKGREQEDAARQQRAASLGPGGSQVPRDEPVTPPAPVDRLAARQGMTAELAQYFNQNP